MAAIKQEYQDILNKYISHRISNEPFSNGPVVYDEQSVIGIINDVAALFENKNQYSYVKTPASLEKATGIPYVYSNDPDIFNQPE